jgi:hypothetical protein
MHLDGSALYVGDGHRQLGHLAFDAGAHAEVGTAAGGQQYGTGAPGFVGLGFRAIQHGIERLGLFVAR